MRFFSAYIPLLTMVYILLFDFYTDICKENNRLRRALSMPVCGAAMCAGGRQKAPPGPGPDGEGAGRVPSG